MHRTNCEKSWGLYIRCTWILQAQNLIQCSPNGWMYKTHDIPHPPPPVKKIDPTTLCKIRPYHSQLRKKFTVETCKIRPYHSQLRKKFTVESCKIRPYHSQLRKKFTVETCQIRVQMSQWQEKTYMFLCQWKIKCSHTSNNMDEVTATTTTMLFDGSINPFLLFLNKSGKSSIVFGLWGACLCTHTERLTGGVRSVGQLPVGWVKRWVQWAME